jgi:hypothetical protein
MPPTNRDDRDRRTVSYQEMSSPPTGDWLFAQCILGNPVRVFRLPPRELTDSEQFIESISDRRFPRPTEPTYVVVSEARLFAHECLGKPLEKSLRGATDITPAKYLSEAGWNPADHPRGGFAQNRGWFSTTAGGGGASDRSSPYAGRGETADYRPDKTSLDGRDVRSTRPPVRSPDELRRQLTGDFPKKPRAELLAFGPGAAPPARPAWPAIGPLPALPSVAGAGAAAGAAGAIAAGGLLGGLSNAAMGAYWQRVPGAQAMPGIWVYELEKRVRSGELSAEDARGIFETARLGAETQGFAPMGSTMSAVHNSAVDFLKKAEAVYFARKKKNEEWARQRGGYQQSGGRVFPTEHNSGLTGPELRQEQEKFFERGLADGREDWYLRGQASNAGLTRRGTPGRDDRLEDPEAEAALQRAIRKARK